MCSVARRDSATDTELQSMGFRLDAACSVARRHSAIDTELQSMGFRLDAGRGQEPIEDVGSNESCSVPLGKVITLCGTLLKNANHHSERSRAGQFCRWSE